MYSLIRSPLVKDSGYLVENVNIYLRIFIEFFYHRVSSAGVIELLIQFSFMYCCLHQRSWLLTALVFNVLVSLIEIQD